MARAVEHDLYLAVDLGTTGLKIALGDSAGTIVLTEYSDYMVDSRTGSVAQQDPRLWWRAFEKVLSKARVKVDLNRVAGICVVGQSPTLVCVDGRGEPVRRAITWADRNAHSEVKWLRERLDAPDIAVEYSVLPRIAWLRRFEPANYLKTTCFLQSFDYLVMCLTDTAVTCQVSELLPWTRERLELAGFDLSKFPTSQVVTGEVMATVSTRAAAATGLRVGVPVVAGTIDSFSHWIGAGLFKPGRLCNVGGTSEGAAVFTTGPLLDPAYRVVSLPHPCRTGWVAAGAMSNSGSVTDWVAGWHAPGARDRLLSQAATIAPGAEGLLALPYLEGERSPIQDPYASGSFLGLRSTHTPAHMVRALIESVCMGLKEMIGLLRDIGGEVVHITVTGGTSRSDVWTRIKADALGIPIHVAEFPESGLLGALILARAGVSGTHPAQIANRMIRYRRVVEPDVRTTAYYDEMHSMRQELYRSTQELNHRLASLAKNEGGTASSEGNL